MKTVLLRKSHGGRGRGGYSEVAFFVHDQKKTLASRRENVVLERDGAILGENKVTRLANQWEDKRRGGGPVCGLLRPKKQTQTRLGLSRKEIRT